MVKVQETIRNNGFAYNFVTIPQSEVEISGLKKGDFVEVKALGDGLLQIKKVNY